MFWSSSMWINVLTAKKPFHSAERCWILHPELKKQINQINGVDSYMVSEWLVDSGSQVNITGNLHFLDNLEKTNLMVATADGKISRIDFKGSVNLKQLIQLLIYLIFITKRILKTFCRLASLRMRVQQSFLGK